MQPYISFYKDKQYLLHPGQPEANIDLPIAVMMEGTITGHGDHASPG